MSRLISPNTESPLKRRLPSSLNPLGRIVSDPRHSSGEERLVMLGLSRDRHLLAVMYVERGFAIRIISARLATRRERRDYEENV